MEAIYIGRKFYSESSSMMSFIYEITESGFSRTDWGFVQRVLENSENVNIRPATIKELDYFNNELLKYKKDEEWRNGN